MGRPVRLVYGPQYRGWAQPHLVGAVGQALLRGRGPGPRNVLVELSDGSRVVVPWGNTRRREEG